MCPPCAPRYGLSPCIVGTATWARPHARCWNCSRVRRGDQPCGVSGSNRRAGRCRRFNSMLGNFAEGVRPGQSPQRKTLMGFIRLKVRTRIYLGFAALVVLSLGIAIFGVMQLSGVGSNVGTMNALAGNTDRVLTAHAAVRGDAPGGNALSDRGDRGLHEGREGQCQPGGQAADRSRPTATLSEERRKTYHARAGCDCARNRRTSKVSRP